MTQGNKRSHSSRLEASCQFWFWCFSCYFFTLRKIKNRFTLYLNPHFHCTKGLWRVPKLTYLYAFLMLVFLAACSFSSYIVLSRRWWLWPHCTWPQQWDSVLSGLPGDIPQQHGVWVGDQRAAWQQGPLPLRRAGHRRQRLPGQLPPPLQWHRAREEWDWWESRADTTVGSNWYGIETLHFGTSFYQTENFVRQSQFKKKTAWQSF